MTLPDTLRYLSLSATDPRSDGELVAEFLRTREESAFAELLRRHGPTVYGVCRRILGDGPDADDAFQAVFLVLARKANAIRPLGMVGNWLYGVAVRTANKARVMNARRMKRDRRTAMPTGATSWDRDSETLALIDTELAAIPAVYRAAFVACDLNGRSRSEAARELGWPEGTVAARLAKARELLAARLRKRGVTLSTAAFAAIAVPTAVSAETLMAVRELLAVGTASTVAPVAQQLSEEVLKSMGTFKLKLMAMVCLAIAFATRTAVLVAGPSEKPGPRAEGRQMANAPVPKELPVELKEEKSIELPNFPVQNFAISPDGKILAAVTSNGLVSLHDPATGAKINKNDFMQLKASATRLAVAFSPEGKLAITGANGVVVLESDRLLGEIASIFDSWKLSEGITDFDPHQLVWLHEEKTGGGWRAGEGRLVATNGVSFKEVGWTRGKREDELKRYEGDEWEAKGAERHGATLLVSAPGANRVFYSAGATKPKQFDLGVRDTKSQPHVVRTLSGHAARPTSGAMSADGLLLLSGDESGDLIAWDGERFTERKRWKLGGKITSVALAPDDRTVAVLRVTETNKDNAISTEWELYAFDATATATPLIPVWRTTLAGSYSKSGWRLPGQTGREDAGPYRASIAFHPDGTKLYASLADPYLKVLKTDPNWRKPAGIRVWSLGRKVHAPVPKAKDDAGLIWTHNVNNKTLTAYTPDGKEVKAVKLPDDALFAGFTPDGTRMAFAGQNGRVVQGNAERTLHLGPIDNSGTGTDTGLGWTVNDKFVCSPDAKQVVRTREEAPGNRPPGIYHSHVLFDLSTKKETPIDLPADHQVLTWSADGKSWGVMHNNLQDPKLPKCRWLTTPSGGKPEPKPVCNTHSFLWSELVPVGKGALGLGWKHVTGGNTPVLGLHALADGKATELVAMEGVNSGTARWSPDGRRVVVMQYEYDPKTMKLGDTAVTVFDADGKNETKLLRVKDDFMASNLVGWFPTPPDLKDVKPESRKMSAPLPKAKFEWKEAKGIELDGGRVTSVVYSPSGKTLAVCRDSGKIDFFDPMTRKHLKTMDVAEDGTTFKDEPTTVGTITAIGFRPTPHEKLGDVFAVTHKNGFKVGTTNNGLVSDPRERESNGLIPGYLHKNCDPHQVVWLEEMTLAWTNGVETQWSFWNEKERGGIGSLLNVPSAKMSQPVVLAAIPGKNAILTSEDLPGSRDDKRKIEFGMNIRQAKITIGTKEEKGNYPLLGHESRPIAAVVAKDGKRIVSADAGGTLIVWEGEKFEFKEKARIELGHGVLQLALAPDGRTVAVVRTVLVEGSEVKGGWRIVEPELHVFDVTDPPVKSKPIWTTKINQDSRKIAGPVSLAFSPDGKNLLAAFGDPYNSGMDDKGFRHTGIIPGSMGIKVWELMPNK